MVEVFGTLEKSVSRNGVTELTFTIPALSERGARRRSKINARLKGVSNREIQSSSKVSDRRYRVTVAGTAS